MLVELVFVSAYVATLQYKTLWETLVSVLLLTLTGPLQTKRNVTSGRFEEDNNEKAKLSPWFKSTQRSLVH